MAGEVGRTTSSGSKDITCHLNAVGPRKFWGERTLWWRGYGGDRNETGTRDSIGCGLKEDTVALMERWDDSQTCLGPKIRTSLELSCRS